MGRFTLVSLVAILVAVPSHADDRIAVRREYFYSSDPAVVKAVVDLSFRTNAESERLSLEQDERTRAYWEQRRRDRASGVARVESTENQLRAGDAMRRSREVWREGDIQLYAELSRRTPYFVLDCVVERGKVETLSAQFRGAEMTFRVAFDGIEDDWPRVSIASWRSFEPLPEPVDLRPGRMEPGIARSAERHTWQRKRPINVAFDRVEVARSDRAIGCRTFEPGGETPPPYPQARTSPGTRSPEPIASPMQ